LSRWDSSQKSEVKSLKSEETYVVSGFSRTVKVRLKADTTYADSIAAAARTR
jgi:YbbR domain-containing protein